MTWLAGENREVGLLLGDYDTRMGLERFWSESPLVRVPGKLEEYYTAQDLYDRAVLNLERGGMRGLDQQLRRGQTARDVDPLRRGIDGYYMRSLVYWALIEDYLTQGEAAGGTIGVVGGSNPAARFLLPWIGTFDVPEYARLAELIGRKRTDKTSKKWIADYAEVAADLGRRKSKMIAEKHPYFQWLQDMGVFRFRSLEDEVDVSEGTMPPILATYLYNEGLPVDQRIAWLPLWLDWYEDIFAESEDPTLDASEVFDLRPAWATYHEDTTPTNALNDAIPFLFSVRRSGNHAFIEENVADHAVFMADYDEDKESYVYGEFDEDGNDLSPLGNTDEAIVEPGYPFHVSDIEVYVESVDLESLTRTETEAQNTFYVDYERTVKAGLTVPMVSNALDQVAYHKGMYKDMYYVLLRSGEIDFRSTPKRIYEQATGREVNDRNPEFIAFRARFGF